MAFVNLIDRLYQLVLAIRADVTALQGASGAKECLRVRMSTTTNSTSAGWQKIPFNTVDYDTNSIWDATNKKATPKKAGYYLMTLRVRFGTSGSMTVAANMPNTSTLLILGSDATQLASAGSAIHYFNGTTDYVEPSVYVTAVRAYTQTHDCHFSMVGPL